MKPTGNKYRYSTTAAMTRYVATTGHDVNGNGSAGAPYATVVRAMRDIPPQIAHAVNIVVAAGSYAAGSWPRHVDPIFVDDGTLTIYGKGAPTRKAVRGGPHTVTAIANIGGTTQEVTVGAAVGWVADEFCGYWLRVVTGGHVGRTWPVFVNDTTHIYIPQDSTGDRVHNGDTVELISPSIIFAVEDACFTYDAHACSSSVAGGYARLVIANIDLDGSTSSQYTQFAVGGNVNTSDGPLFEFVRMTGLSAGTTLTDTILNIYPGIDATYLADCDTSILNMGEATTGPGTSMYSTTGRSDIGLYQYSGRIYNTAVFGTIQWWGSSPTFYGGCGAVTTSGSAGGVAMCCVAGIDNATPAVSVANGDYQLKVNVIKDCNYAVDVGYLGFVYFHSANTCSATLCTLSALRIGPSSHVTIKDNCAGFLGATVGQQAYISAANPAVKSATWPAVSTLVSDTLGGQLLRTT